MEVDRAQTTALPSLSEPLIALIYVMGCDFVLGCGGMPSQCLASQKGEAGPAASAAPGIPRSDVGPLGFACSRPFRFTKGAWPPHPFVSLSPGTPLNLPLRGGGKGGEGEGIWVTLQVVDGDCEPAEG